MNLEKVFKNSILIFGAVFIVFFLKSLMGITYMNQELYDYQLNNVSSKDFVILVIAIINIISLFFLYSFKRIGKIIFASTFILLILSALLLNEIILDGADYFLDGLHTALGSIIFFILYFSPNSFSSTIRF